MFETKKFIENDNSCTIKKYSKVLSKDWYTKKTF